MSVVGGGEKFPKIIGRPRWVSDRTLRVSVKLVPDHDYWLSINSDRFTNFRGKNGEPAEPHPVSFKTKKADPGGDAKPAPKAQRLTPEENRDAVAELRRAIDQDYSYRDRMKLDWDALFKAATPELEAAATPDEFARAAAKALAPANDMHLWLEANGKLVGSHSRRVPHNLNRDTLARLVPGWRQRGTGVYTGRFDDGIGYVLIDSWDASRAEGVRAAIDFLAGLKDAPGYVIDVRPNAGGSETLAATLAGCFVAEPVVYARHRTRFGGELSPPAERVLSPAEPHLHRKVAVLMGLANMSSCESFLMMMRRGPDCVLVGERSFGSSGNPQPIALGNGVTAYIPSWQDLDVDGTPIEGKGIAPDVEVVTHAADLQSADSVLAAALAAIRSKEQAVSKK
jgi:hypothetical protein